MSTFLNFGKTASATEQLDIPVYEGFIEPTGSGLMDLLAESAQDSYQLQAGLLIADIALENTLVTEGMDAASVVLESVVGDSVKKAKANIVKLFAKVRAWFTQMIQNLKVMFTSGEKFIDKYGKMIDEKDVKGFEYKGRQLTVEAGSNTATKLRGAISAKINETVAKVETVKTHITAANKNAEGGAGASSEDMKKAVLTAAGVEEVTDIKKNVVLAFYGAKEEAYEIKDFSANGKGELKDIVKNASKAIAEVEKAKAETEKSFTAVIKALDKAGSEVASDSDNANRGAAVVHLNKMTAVAQYGLTLLSTVSAAQVDALKSTAKDAEKTLKKYLSFNPKADKEQATKESTTVVEESSLLSLSMRLI